MLGAPTHRGRDGRLRGPRHNYRTAGGTGLQSLLRSTPAPRRPRVRDGDLELSRRRRGAVLRHGPARAAERIYNSS